MGNRGPLDHRVFILSSGEQQLVGEVLAAFRQSIPSLEFYEVADADANYPVKSEGPGPLPANRRAREILGWTPRTSFADGMREYLNWIVTNGPQQGAGMRLTRL